MQILIKHWLRDHVKNTSLRKMASLILYIDIISTLTIFTNTKKVRSSPGLPYVNDAYSSVATPKSMLTAWSGLAVTLKLSRMSPHITEKIAVSRRCR
jgi:hypothetical protein